MHKIVRLFIVVVCLFFLFIPLWRDHFYPITIDIGSEERFLREGETAKVRGFFLFYEREVQGQRTFRWTAGRATLMIPYALRIQPLLLEITACRCLPHETLTPFDIYLNDKFVVTTPATSQWRKYLFLVTPQESYPDQSLMIDIRVPTWTDTNQRSLGLAMDEVKLVHIPTSKDPLFLTTLIIGIIIAGLSYWSHSLLLPFLSSISWFMVTIFYQPWVLSLYQTLVLLIFGLIILWLPLWTTALHSTKPRTQYFYAFITTGIAVWLVLSPQILDSWIIDDAYISFRYARNLLDGYGLVFNIGERVEGFTNFLWTMIIAGSMSINIDPVIASAILNMLLAYICVSLTVALATHLVRLPWVWTTPLLLSLASPFLIYSSCNSGMETALFTALSLATFLALVQERWIRAGIFTVCTLLTRPDGIVLAGIATLYAIYSGWHKKKGYPITREQAVPLMRYIFAIAFFYVPYFLWRWNYYGYIFPNTFYAKVHGTHDQILLGYSYLWSFGNTYLILWIGALGGIIGYIATYKFTAPWHILFLLGAFLLSFICYIVIVGGDWMPGSRFFVVTIPILAILTTWGIDRIVQRFPASAPLGIIFMFGIVTLQITVLIHDTSYEPEDYITRRYREVGRWINKHTAPDTLIATGVAGALPYYAQRTAIDALGLTDSHIAHASSEGVANVGKVDVDYVMQRRPDIIPRNGSVGLWEHPDFEKDYELKQFPGPEGYMIELYVRKDRNVIVGDPF